MRGLPGHEQADKSWKQYMNFGGSQAMQMLGKWHREAWYTLRIRNKQSQ